MRVRTPSGASRKGLVAALAVALMAVTGAAAPAVVARAAAQSICPGADLEPTTQDLPAVRAATICLVNLERSLRSERPLAPRSRLELAAQRHARSMALGGYFAHVGPSGDTPLSRIRATGYISRARIDFELGENIGWGTLWLATPRSIVAAWMASPGHRANILDPRFRATAVGVFPQVPASLGSGQPGAVYTQDFGSY